MRIVAFAFAVLVSGCASVDYSQRSTEGDASVGDVPTTWQAVQATMGEVEVGWIASFEDSVLSGLVAEALVYNRNLQASAANVDRAWALARQAGAAIKPTVGLSAGSENSGTGEGGSSSSALDVGLQASWELDLWGRIRAGEGAALASAEAAEADFRYAQHSLAAGVSRAYFIAVEAAQQGETARDVVDALVQTLKIVNLQFQEGMATAQDVALTRSDLASARESLAATEGGQRDALRALEILLGRYPSADISVGLALPEPPEQPPAGLPSSLLERRPDLVAAERRIAASIAGVDQAKAARLPQVSLSANIGGSSTELSDLLDPSNVLWRAASSLLVPVVDGGARKAQVELADADQQAAVAAYAQAALNAFGEVEQALDQGVVLARRMENLNQARNEAGEALRLARLRFDEGETDLLDVLSIQQRYFGRQSSLVALRRSLLEQYVDLNLALGGEW